MNYIEKKAWDVANTEFDGNHFDEADDLLRTVEEDISDVDDPRDKLSYVTVILEANDTAYSEHLKVCTYPEGCLTNKAHERVNYYMQQHLQRLGIKISNDSFTREEKSTISDRLDEILANQEELKNGHRLIYDDLMAEIDELKKWFILGKQNWKHLAAGKIGEMVAGGVISEATAKPFLEAFRNLPKLLGM